MTKHSSPVSSIGSDPACNGLQSSARSNMKRGVGGALTEAHGTRAEDVQEAYARSIAAIQALRRLDEIATGDTAQADAARRLRDAHRQKARRCAARNRDRHTAPNVKDQSQEAGSADGSDLEWRTYRWLRSEMMVAERRKLLELRERGVICDDVMRRAQRALDLETMSLEAAEDNNAPDSPYEPR